VPLALALGYDSVVGVAIPFVGSQVGFAAAFLNPFNVGIAQGIAGIPVFSGMGYRLLVWALATAATIAFLMWYAARVKADPQRSPTYALDQEKRQAMPADDHIADAHAPRGVVDFRRHAGGDGGRRGALRLVYRGNRRAVPGDGHRIGMAGKLDSDTMVEGFVQGARSGRHGAGDRAGARRHGAGARCPHHRHHAARADAAGASSSPCSRRGKCL
jgi:hypothetical protein